MDKKFQVQSPFSPAGDQPKAIESLVEGIQNGLRKQTLLGVTGSGKTFTVAHVIQECQRPALIMAPNKTLAAQLYGEMKEFFPNNAVEYFVSYYDFYQPEAYLPSTDTFIEKDAAINEHIEQMRLSATKALMERRDVIIVATVSAIYGLGDPKSYFSMLLHLSRGDRVDQRTILRRLAEMQYTRNDIDFHRATYRVRGDVIDIFPADSAKEALRIELFGDEIENISTCDPLTGQVIQRIPRVTVFPKTHYVTPREKLLDMSTLIRKELEGQVAFLKQENKLVEAQRLDQRTRFDLEMILELGYCSGIENYSRYLSGRGEGESPPTLFDYFPPDSLLFLDESHVTVSQITGMYRGDRSRKETLVKYGFRLPSALDNRPMRFDEFDARGLQTVYVSATPGDYELAESDNVAEQVARPTGLLDPEIFVKPASNQVDDFIGEIRSCVLKGERVLVTTLTKRMSEQLSEYLGTLGIKARYLHSEIHMVERMEIIRDLRLGVFDVLIGINLLREGLDIPEVALVAIMDADKKGFLRSTRSLIQTMGRAARHVEGRVILYADSITNSMEAAMSETRRRREVQTKFNADHGLVPTGISKAIQDVMEGAHSDKASRGKRSEKISENVMKYEGMSPKELEKIIKKLHTKMLQHARDLEFEEAAAVRDQINHIEKSALGLP